MKTHNAYTSDTFRYLDAGCSPMFDNCITAKYLLGSTAIHYYTSCRRIYYRVVWIKKLAIRICPSSSREPPHFEHAPRGEPLLGTPPHCFGTVPKNRRPGPSQTIAATTHPNQGRSADCSRCKRHPRVTNRTCQRRIYPCSLTETSLDIAKRDTLRERARAACRADKAIASATRNGRRALAAANLGWPVSMASSCDGAAARSQSLYLGDA